MNLLKKCGFYFLTMLLLLIATFLLMKLIPGDPFSDEKGIPQETIEAYYRHYGLDQPLINQLITYMTSILRFDFGISIYYPGKSVNAMIKDSFPVSLTLGLLTLSLAIGGGIILGSLAALVHSKRIDSLVTFAACFLVAIPNFCIALLLQYLLSVKLGLFPLGQFHSFSHAVLPVLSLALFPMAYLARLIRAHIIEVRELAFVKTAISKGLSPWSVSLKHILPNALVPALGVLGQLAASIIVGSFVIEKIFAIPGIGGHLVKSVLARDYPAIMGLTAFFAYILFACTFLCELLTYWIDPRLRSKP